MGGWCVCDKLYTCNYTDMLQCLLMFVVYMLCTFPRSMSRSPKTNTGVRALLRICCFFMSFAMLPHNFQDSVMPNVLSRCFWNHPTRLWRKDMTKCLKSRDLHFGVPFSHFDLAPPNGVYLSLGEGFSNINSQRAYPNSKQIDTSSLYPMNLWRSLEVWGSYGSFPQQAPTSPCPWTTHDCWWMTLTPRTWHFYSTQRIFRPQLQCKTLKNPFKRIEGIRFL